MKNNDINPIQRLIEAGSNMTGAAVGGAVGFVLGGAEGAAIGASGGGLLTSVLKTLGDVAHRNLSDREEIRVGAAAAFAIEKIRTKLEAGEIPRDDGFFQESEKDSRSNAEEIFEGALLKSKNEHEEKKIRIIANIFANIAFYSEISTSEANHILQVAENMTYRQMCFLALFERKAEDKDINLATKFFPLDSYEDTNPIINDLSALQEIYELYNFGLVRQIEVDSNNNPPTFNNIYLSLSNLDDVIPDKMQLTDLGKRYYSIMDLFEIPKEDLEEVAITLSK
jgi:hypothetical protein